MGGLVGVNIGGWLVPERWITPSLFRAGPPSMHRLKQHVEAFITPDDIAWLALHNVQAIRIPVPHNGGWDPLDPIIAAAGWHGMRVVLDMHTAPGSQNGWDHSGGTGEMLWHTDPANIAATLAAVEALAQRYATAPNVWAIGVLNEPRWDIPHDILAGYYQQSYARVRASCGDRVAVIFSDAFRPRDWRRSFPSGQYKNVALDMHLYQCFSPEDKALSADGHMHKTRTEWAALIKDMQQTIPVIVGEWSGALDPITFKDGTAHDAQHATRRYIAAQQQVFSASSAHFYWTYKTEQNDTWNFRHCVESGLLRIPEDS